MAKLTSQKRRHLKGSQFAEPGKRKYPINNPSHARNALARVSQHGTSSEKTEVRRKVHAKYPNIGVTGLKGRKEKAHKNRHKISLRKG
jgi:hypothetical protein